MLDWFTLDFLSTDLQSILFPQASGLNKRTDAQLRQAQALQAKIERLFSAASAIDVAFIVDVTGSMGSWIAAVKEQVRFVQTHAGLSSIV